LPYLGRKECVTKSLKHEFSLACEIESFSDVITGNEWELRLITRSLEYFKHPINVMPLRE